MSNEDNKALVQRLIEGVWNTGNYSELDEIAGPTFAASTEQANRSVREALPDLRNTIHDLIAEGDKVVAYWSCAGTHKGVWSSHIGKIAPTGNSVTFTAIHIFRIEDGRIVERWAVIDALGMLQEMNALPTVT